MAIRGVQGAGVLKTLLDRRLITAAGRKNVVGRPILYKTTKEFLVQFGLKDVSELPTLKEFEELRRLAVGQEDEPALPAEGAAVQSAPADDEQATQLAGPRDEAAAAASPADGDLAPPTADTASQPAPAVKAPQPVESRNDTKPTAPGEGDLPPENA
jgi:segregation and condensation protein B